jgi:hypothetical protein
MTRQRRRRLASDRGLSMRALPIGGRRFRAVIYDTNARRPVAECLHEHRGEMFALDCALEMVPRFLDGAA